MGDQALLLAGCGLGSGETPRDVALRVTDDFGGGAISDSGHPRLEGEDTVMRLLRRNARMYGVGFSIDTAGDVYLTGRVSLRGLDADELDRLLGSVLTYADESFNTILELGFASSIRKEWEWRKLRGEPTENLAAFRGWLESGEEPAAD